MLICSISHLEGTSTKTGKPYDCYKIEGLGRAYDGSIRCENAMINPAEFVRADLKVGDVVRVFRDGGVYVQAKNAFDFSLFDGVF